jgi:hypothetical protein
LAAGQKDPLSNEISVSPEKTQARRDIREKSSARQSRRRHGRQRRRRRPSRARKTDPSTAETVAEIFSFVTAEKAIRSRSYDLELQRRRCKIYRVTNSMARLRINYFSLM